MKPRIHLLGFLTLTMSCDASDESTHTETFTSTTTNTVTSTTPTTDTGSATTRTTIPTTTQKTTTTETTEPEPPPIIDCGEVPDRPTSIEQLEQPTAYHSIVFDDENNLVGTDEFQLFKSPDPDNVELWIPNIRELEQMDILPDGDIVALSTWEGSLIRLKPDGTRTTIKGNLQGYGLIVGPDNMVYVADSWMTNSILRIDPDTGFTETYISGFPGDITAKVITFNRDYSRMYIGTVSDIGAVLFVDLGKNLEPISEIKLFTDGTGAWHDGIGMDACGNLYVNDVSASQLLQISQDGTVTVFYWWPNSDYGHGHTWGTGIGPWDDHTLYLPQPYVGYRVLAMEIGVPNAHWNDGYYVTINE
jgi:hypothetical protein